MRPRSVLLAAATICYPVFVYFLLQRHDAGAIVIALCVLGILRMALAREWIWGVLVLGLAAATFLTSHSLPAKLYPVIVNLGLLAAFGHSLFRPPSVVERIARVREPSLPPQAVIYTRRVTMLWCAFFMVNAAVAGWLAIRGTDEAWALYSGGISYLLAGLLFAGEFLVRQQVRRKWSNA